MAERSGVDVETLKMHYRGFRWPDKQPVVVCFKRTERLFLTARFSAGDGYRYPSVGIRRRLQALQAAGFTLAVVASLVDDKDVRQIHATMCGKTNAHFVTAPYATAIITAYDKLYVAQPVDWGVTPRSVAYAKTVAAKNNYAPPGCWDEDTIDDPDAFPEWTGACGTLNGVRIHRRDGIPLCPACSNLEDGKPVFSIAKFQAVRASRGLTVGALERLAGTTAALVYHWEKGHSTPNQEHLERVLSVLDVTFEEVCED